MIGAARKGASERHQEFLESDALRKPRKEPGAVGGILKDLAPVRKPGGEATGEEPRWVEKDEAAKLRRGAGRVQRLRDCDGRRLRREREGRREEVRPKSGVRGERGSGRENPGGPAGERGGRHVEERARRPLGRNTWLPRGACLRDE